MLLLRLGLTAVLSGAIGWDREVHRRAAGLRTHMLVGISSALFVMLGHDVVHSFSVQPELTGTTVRLSFDPMNLIQAVIAGVSFLGAGTIFVSRDDRVRGLTTAASLLATASVGVAVAMGRFAVGIGTTLLFLFILAVLSRVQPAARKGSDEPAQ
jgi:putative Mg2+ transporter-C (MgtC) family protein